MKLVMPTLNYKDKAIEFSTYEATALKVYDVFGAREVLLSCDKSNETSSNVAVCCRMSFIVIYLNLKFKCT